MDPFFVEQVPDHLLKQMVEKFKTGAEGGAFYRCNKYSKYFVEKVKPVWPLPDSRIGYYPRDLKVVNGIKVVKEARKDSDGLRNGLSNAPLEFCQVLDVDIDTENVDYYKRVIFPELKTIGAIEWLSLNVKLPEDDVRELLEAAKPEELEINGSYYDATSAVFKDIKHLEIKIELDGLNSDGGTEKIFELAHKSTTVNVWISYDSSHEVVTNFIQAWLQGKPTGLLTALTFYTEAEDFRKEHVEAILDHVDPSLITRRKETDEGYIIEGQRGRLQIVAEYNVDNGGGYMGFDLS